MVRFITSTLGVLGLVLLTSCNQEEYYAKEYLTPYNGVTPSVKNATPIPGGTITIPGTNSGTTTPGSEVTPTPTATPDATVTPTATATPDATVTPVPTATPVITVTPEPTPIVIVTPTPVPTATPVVTPTPVPTSTPVVTPTPVPTSTPVVTPTPVPTATATPAPGQKLVKDEFTQNSAQAGKVDILWVIDNSGSMADNQNNLAYNFDAFIRDFITKGIDFKMAVTTTDATFNYNGREICGEDKLSLTQAQANQTQFIYDFQNCVRVGDNGSSYEKGLHTMNEYFKKYSSSFLRPDAYLVVIVLSDEEDQSSLSVSTYANALKAYKAQAGLIKYYGLVTTVIPYPRTVESIGNRYMQMRDLVGGTIADITSDFYQTLTDFGGSILNLMTSFALSANPLSSIVVKVNGTTVTSGWTYNSQTRSIQFDDQSIPPEGALITVEYYVEQT